MDPKSTAGRPPALPRRRSATRSVPSACLNEAVFDLVVAGRLNHDRDEIDILMIEAEATGVGCPQSADECCAQAYVTKPLHPGTPI